MILVKLYSITTPHESKGKSKQLKKDSWEHYRQYISVYMILSSLDKNSSEYEKIVFGYRDY